VIDICIFRCKYYAVKEILGRGGGPAFEHVKVFVFTAQASSARGALFPSKQCQICFEKGVEHVSMGTGRLVSGVTNMLETSCKCHARTLSNQSDCSFSDFIALLYSSLRYDINTFFATPKLASRENPSSKLVLFNNFGCGSAVISISPFDVFL
jgi:hypothetical protein